MKRKKRQQQPLFLGAHLSIAGGLHHAPIKAREYECDVLQIFTKNATHWKERNVTDEEATTFSLEVAKSGVRSVSAHASYLINLASPEDAVYEQSISALQNEMRRSERLGIAYVIVHPGAHKGKGETWGLKRIAKGIERIFTEVPQTNCLLLLETTAGQGTNVGYRFEHLAAVRDLVGAADRIGFCLDTSHIFSAGYDIRTRKGYDHTMAAFEGAIGLSRLRVLHLNDSKKDCGSRVDRHEHIGRGKIGIEAFRFIMNDPRLREVPKIIETPKKEGGIDWDPKNLALLRSLVSA